MYKPTTICGERAKKYLLALIEDIDQGEIADLIIIYSDINKSWGTGPGSSTPDGMTHKLKTQLLRHALERSESWERFFDSDEGKKLQCLIT